MPGTLTETRLVDASLRMLADAPLALKHGAEVFLHIGSDSVFGALPSARLRDHGARPDGVGAVQGWSIPSPVRDMTAMSFAWSHRAIPWGGGQVVEPSPMRRHRRMRAEVIERLRVLAKGSPLDVMRLALRGRGVLAGGPRRPMRVD